MLGFFRDKPPPPPVDITGVYQLIREAEACDRIRYTGVVKAALVTLLPQDDHSEGPLRFGEAPSKDKDSLYKAFDRDVYIFPGAIGWPVSSRPGVPFTEVGLPLSAIHTRIEIILDSAHNTATVVVGPPHGGYGMLLRCKNEEDAIVWRNAIKAERDRIYWDFPLDATLARCMRDYAQGARIPYGDFDLGFNLNTHDGLMRREVYYGSLKADGDQVPQAPVPFMDGPWAVVATLHQRFRSVVPRMQTDHDTVVRAECDAFSDMFKSCMTSSDLLMVLLAFDFKSDLLIPPPAVRPLDPVALQHDLIERFSKLIILMSDLCRAAHSALRILPVPFPEKGVLAGPHVTVWVAATRSALEEMPELEYNDIEKLLSPNGAFLAFALMRGAANKGGDEGVAIAIDVLKRADPTVLRAAFQPHLEPGVDYCSAGFPPESLASFLFHPNLLCQHASMCEVLLDAGLMSAPFLGTYISEAVRREGGLQPMRAFICSLVTPTGFNTTKLRKMEQPAAMIIDALARASDDEKINADTDTIRSLVEIALRFECPAVDLPRTVGTLTTWLAAEPNGGKLRKERAMALFARCEILSWMQALTNANDCARPITGIRPHVNGSGIDAVISGGGAKGGAGVMGGDDGGARRGAIPLAGKKPLVRAPSDSDMPTRGGGHSPTMSAGWEADAKRPVGKRGARDPLGKEVHSASSSVFTNPLRREGNARVPDVQPPRPLNDHIATQVHATRNAIVDWRYRSPDAMMQALYGIFSFALSPPVKEPAILLTFLSDSSMESFFTTHLSVGSDLRKRVLALIKSIYKPDPRLFSLAEAGELLMRASDFAKPVLNLLSDRSAGVDSDIYVGLVLAAVRLQDVVDISIKVKTAQNLCVVSEEHTMRLRSILEAVKCTSVSHFFPAGPQAPPCISLSDISQCAKFASDAVNMLKFLPAHLNLNEFMDRMFNNYLTKREPTAWLELFKAAEVVAMFLKYFKSEDLDKAFAAFTTSNPPATSGDDVITPLLNAARKLLTKPLIDTHHADLDLSDDKAMKKVMLDLETMASGAKVDPVMKWLMMMCPVWMRNRKELVGTYMMPRNAQMISTIVCAQWLQQLPPKRTSKEDRRMLIGQVGTGEGKSLIIAMTSVYVVKALGKKVHVLTNNQSLLSRDQGDFESIYTALGVTSAARGDGKTADITYCLRSDIDGYYSDGMFTPPSMFPNTVIIVDEVDELVVDGEPNQSYVTTDSALSHELGCAFEALKADGGRPGEVSEKIWREARGAVADASRMIKRVDYAYNSAYGQYSTIDDRGNFTNLYHLWLEWVNFNSSGNPPHYQTSYMTLCTPHMYNRYHAVIGFSGSLGSPAEKEFLVKTFKATFFVCPPFLNTCLNVEKHPPTLICTDPKQGNVIAVAPSFEEQVLAVAKLALAKRLAVPVLVICKSADVAKQMADGIRAVLMKSGGAGDPAKCVQLFRQRGEDENESLLTWAQQKLIIDNATTLVSGANSLGRKEWAITVTDYSGGRGHDYRILDDGADKAGGLCVIACQIPSSEREWTQWKGRTARNDRKGQYAVILSVHDEPLKGNTELLAEIKVPSHGSSTLDHLTALLAPSHLEFFSSDAIARMLATRDVDRKTIMDKRALEIVNGSITNELCDKFYDKLGRGPSADWPHSREEKELRDFLTLPAKGQNLEAARAAAVRLRLVARPEAYTSVYA